MRRGYRVAYRLAQAWWWVARPRVTGVKCALRDGDRVVLVRHAYGDRTAWNLPGGQAHRGEPPARAARREMFEELGVDVAEWTSRGTLALRPNRKRETLHVLEAPLPPGARLRVAPGELLEARLERLDAPPGRLGPSTSAAAELLS